MKQMKKNSEELRSSIHVLSGYLETRKSNDVDDELTMYLKLDSRVISIQNNEVSSVAPNARVALKEITDTIQRQCPNTDEYKLLAVVSSQDNESVVELSKFKAVKRKGKTVLKMNASVDELDASGKYVENSISLDNFLSEGIVTITCYYDPYYGCVM